jgi:hypothetical protein
MGHFYIKTTRLVVGGGCSVYLRKEFPDSRTAELESTPIYY